MENNGLITKIWGPQLWESLHSITFGYPVKPTKEDKEKYKRYFELTGEVLPCKYCCDSYRKFITTGETKLTDQVFESRQTVSKWMFDLHNAVNKKLGVEYGTTFDNVLDKYESYRAKCIPKDNGCTMPLRLKAESYKKAKYRNAPYLDYKVAKKLIKYAEIRGLNNFSSTLQQTIKIKSNSPEWQERNKKCWKIIDYMREKGISCTESEGLYSGHPTTIELILISLLSTNISSNEMSEIIKKKSNSGVKLAAPAVDVDIS